MAMPEETKQHLRQCARKKRGVKLKDYTPTDLLMATDCVKERYGDLANVTVPETNFAYFKYATPAQVEGAAQGLPHRLTRLRYRAGRDVGERDVVAFLPEHLKTLLACLSLKHDSYMGVGQESCFNRFLRDTCCSPLLNDGGARRAVASWPGWQDARFFRVTTRERPQVIAWRGNMAVCRRAHFDPSRGHFLACRVAGPVIIHGQAPDLAGLSRFLCVLHGWDGLEDSLDRYFWWDGDS